MQRDQRLVLAVKASRPARNSDSGSIRSILASSLARDQARPRGLDPRCDS